MLAWPGFTDKYRLDVWHPDSVPWPRLDAARSGRPLALCVACWAYCKRSSGWRLAAMIAAAGSLWLINRNLWALAAVPLMLLAPAVDVPIPRLRHLFYAYYPLHLVALWAARRCLS